MLCNKRVDDLCKVCMRHLFVQDHTSLLEFLAGRLIRLLVAVHFYFFEQDDVEGVADSWKALIANSSSPQLVDILRGLLSELRLALRNKIPSVGVLRAYQYLCESAPRSGGRARAFRQEHHKLLLAAARVSGNCPENDSILIKAFSALCSSDGIHLSGRHISVILSAASRVRTLTRARTCCYPASRQHTYVVIINDAFPDDVLFTLLRLHKQVSAGEISDLMLHLSRLHPKPLSECIAPLTPLLGSAIDATRVLESLVRHTPAAMRHHAAYIIHVSLFSGAVAVHVSPPLTLS